MNDAIAYSSGRLNNTNTTSRPPIQKKTYGGKFLRSLMILIISALLPLALHAEPIIHSYDVDINIYTDAKIIVSETINITTDGERIKHGIFRDIPTQYKTAKGYPFNIGLNVISIKLDGSEVHYEIVNMYNGIRIYIGQSDISLPEGTYTYQMTYTVNRALGFFSEFDELYWNATGNGWAYPIEHASVRVSFPDTGKITQATAYTGIKNARERNYTLEYPQANEAYFRTNKTLPPQNGLSIVVGFPKGLIHQPDYISAIKQFLHGNINLIIVLIGYLILISFYLYSWFYMGRDPVRKVVIPLFEPPEGFSPEGLAYIKNMEFDNKLFTAAIINMAVKKYLTIEELTDKKYILKAISDDWSMLSPEERIISKQLFKVSNSIMIDQANHLQISSAIDEFKDKLDKEYVSRYFRTNSSIFYLGIFFSIMSFLPLLMQDVTLSQQYLYIAILELCILIPKCSTPRDKNIYLTIVSVLMTIGIVWCILFLPLYYDFFIVNYVLVVIIMLLFISTNGLFYSLMKCPTRVGSELLAKTLGFEMYLRATEEDRMNFLNPPEKTPALFERYLPFAFALGLDQEWSNQFSEVLIQSQYKSTWYLGGNYHSFSSNSFSNSIGSALNSSISASSSAPGSSSGFGGGGGSGGGGGGGGGGGW